MISPYRLKRLIGEITIILVLALTVAPPLISAKTGQDSTGTSDLSSIDSDRDGLSDAEDAVPNDIEINWPKTPESRYVWIEQVNEVDPVDHRHQPRAVNKHGQILFCDTRFPTGGNVFPGTPLVNDPKNLWNSATKEWVSLPYRGSQSIDVLENHNDWHYDIDGTPAVLPEGQHVFNFNTGVFQFIDINDEGSVYGVCLGVVDLYIDPLTPGMVWKRTGTSLTQYAAPNYFHPKYPFPAAGGESTVYREFAGDVVGAIANDGTINSLAYHSGAYDWMTYDSTAYNSGTAASASMQSVRLVAGNPNIHQTFPGAILDKDLALFVETIDVEGVANHCHLWLKEEATQTDLSFMTPQPVDLAEMSYTPNLKNNGSKRLWITTGEKVILEKRAGGTGAARWHNPPSMGEGAIRLNAQGLGITCGQPDPTAPIPPKLWRNGIYTDLNEVTSMPATVTITEAIDLASNGIILVRATENGVAKTGLLLPVDLVLAIPKPEEEEQPPVLAVASASTIQFQSSSAQASSQSSGDIDFATAPKVIIPEDKEDTEGGWAVLNFDDDDEDGGASGHGQASVKGDWEDTNGVEGENDLIYMAIRKVNIPDVKFRLKFADEHIRIYKKSNKTEPVTSEVTELTVPEDKEHFTLFIEGIKPHEDDEGTIITQQIKIGASGAWNTGDTAKVRVAQPIIAVFEDNPDWADTYFHFNDFGKDKAGDNKSRKRFTLKSAGILPDTFMAPGKFFKPGGGELKDVCYSFSQIRGAKGERILKIALALQNANVITIGHSNFGMGLAFKGQYTEFTDFFNAAGGGKPAINLIHGFPAHPALNVEGIFTNLAAADKINSLRWTSAANRWMTNNPLPNIVRYPNAENPVITPGTAFPVHSDTITQVGSNGQILGSRILNWNYKPIPGLEGDGPLDKRVILNVPSTDVPATLKYRSLYLNQCVSYRYFLESFHHGTVFATWSCIKPDNHGHEGFINKMLEGANWESVEVELEEKEAVDDPIGIPRPNRIELSNF